MIVTRYGTLFSSCGGTSTPRIDSSDWTASANPKTRAARNAPIGCQAPKMIAASAMKPLPAVISIWKLPAVESDRYEPASPAISAGEEQRPIADRDDVDADGAGGRGLLAGRAEPEAPAGPEQHVGQDETMT